MSARPRRAGMAPGTASPGRRRRWGSAAVGEAGGSGSPGREEPEGVEEAPGLPWPRCVALGHPETRAWRLVCR